MTGSSPLPESSDVTLRLHCPACDGPIRVTYRPSIGNQGLDVWNRYTCPHCGQRVELGLPGLLLPPVLPGDDG